MTWGEKQSKAILHVDGDAFFASCEVAKNPSLRGKPVIVGKERGIVSAASYEAKARGVIRGASLYAALKACPEAIVLPGDYEAYSIFSRRMYSIVRRYTPDVEEYSIDECFADLTGMRRALHLSYPQMAERIREDLRRELGMTFSVGLASTKVLAKVGSKWKKPNGLTIISAHDRMEFLEKTKAGSVWGIGPQTAQYLAKYGVFTAGEFAGKSEAWVKSLLSKPSVEIWQELNGVSVMALDTVGKSGYHSISKTRTFTPPSNDSVFIFSQLSKNIELACNKAREWNLEATEASIFLKTQDFRYHQAAFRLPMATNIPHDMIRTIAGEYKRIFRPGTLYRTTGITLLKLRERTATQMDLFGASTAHDSLQRVYEKVDALSARYGTGSVFLASSFNALKSAEKESVPAYTRLSIPSMGEVS